MSRINISIGKNGVTFTKGMGQFTIPSNEKPKKKTIYHVCQDNVDKIKVGKSLIEYGHKIGTIISKPVYRKFVNFGFWYADVKWVGGKSEKLNLSKMGIKIEP